MLAMYSKGTDIFLSFQSMCVIVFVYPLVSVCLLFVVSFRKIQWLSP